MKETSLGLMFAISAFIIRITHSFNQVNEREYVPYGKGATTPRLKTFIQNYY